MSEESETVRTTGFVWQRAHGEWTGVSRDGRHSYHRSRDTHVIELLEHASTTEAERARLEQWVHDLQSGMYVNCVYCGHRYGPGETTPVSMADALKAHIEQCPHHPMYKLAAQLAEARAKLAWLDNPIPIQGSGVIVPWKVALPHDNQCRKNHGGQSLERLCQRGGPGLTELAAILGDHEFRYITDDEAREEIRAHLAIALAQEGKR